MLPLLTVLPVLRGGTSGTSYIYFERAPHLRKLLAIPVPASLVLPAKITSQTFANSPQATPPESKRILLLRSYDISSPQKISRRETTIVTAVTYGFALFVALCIYPAPVTPVNLTRYGHKSPKRSAPAVDVGGRTWG